MGISLKQGVRASGFPDESERSCDAHSYNFYSALSWIEEGATEQLTDLTHKKGVQQIAAFPDLHPGKYGPVGVSILADRVYPDLIGNDIGCGMSLFALDIEVRKLKLEKCAQKLRQLEGAFFEGGDVSPPFSEELHSRLDRYDLLELANNHDLFLHSLGTIGGGNHFCEVQEIGDVFETSVLEQLNIDKRHALLFVHSGSRGFGMSVFQTVQDCFAEGLSGDSTELRSYLNLHDGAVRWASLNRQIIAERAANALRGHCKLLVDCPHNLVEKYGDNFLHRKGAAKADLPVVQIAGSRDALSYLVKPTDEKDLKEQSLFSLAHGSGRKYDRKSMKGRVGRNKSELNKLQRTSFGGHVVCEDKQLLVEEAPSAYKNSEAVLSDLVDAQLVTPLLSLRPLLTFKKANKEIENTIKNSVKPSRKRRGRR
ncbi:RNA ligase RtcB family protein [Hyphomicrobiales bacterium 4NK60-0047b]